MAEYLAKRVIHGRPWFIIVNGSDPPLHLLVRSLHAESLRKGVVQRIHFEEKKWVAECGRRINSNVRVKPREGMKRSSTVTDDLALRRMILLFCAVYDPIRLSKFTSQTSSQGICEGEHWPTFNIGV